MTFWSCEDIGLPNACNDIYAPVCGSNGVTYGNDCNKTCDIIKPYLENKFK